MPATFPANLILLDLIILFFLGEEHSYTTQYYETVSRPLLFHPSWVQIFFSPPPLVYVLPLLSEKKFHTHTKL
jgi:hypothetical protein